MPHITSRLTQDLIADEAKKALAGATTGSTTGATTGTTTRGTPGGRQVPPRQDPDKRNSPVPLMNVTIFIV